MSRSSPWAAALFLLAGGCHGPDVGVEEVGPQRVNAELNANAIGGGQPSTVAREMLHLLNLEELFEQDPDAALREMHRTAVEEPRRDLLYALSELSFATGLRLESRDHFLAAAVYAYCYLLDTGAPDPPNPFDRRFRWACEIYNLGLGLGLRNPAGPEILLDEGVRELPVGSVAITVDHSSTWSEDRIFRFLPADDFLVRGLSLRHRTSGLGTPVVGLPTPGGGADPQQKFLPPRLSVPATVFLRLAGGIRDIEGGIAATLEIHDSFGSQETRLDERVVPLEADLTTPLAYVLQTSDIWSFDLRGLFGGSHDERANRLFMVGPYQPGRIPVVFVHGTASNPARWAEMFNTLQADPALRGKIQSWFFVYETGNPIAYSAGKLRDALHEIVQTLDPEGQDPALRRMVVIGHSQGGLLTRLMVTDGDLAWMRELSGISMEELGLGPEQEKLVRWALDFDPVSHVERVVFVSTPHRGSFLAKRRFASFFSNLIALPGEVVDIGKSLVALEDRLPAGMRPKIATSLENMKPGQPFLAWLGRQPIAPGVKVHSIVAVKGDDPLEEEDDGVVEYTSAHLEQADSEFVVRSGHSCQEHPLTIREVRRILKEHLAAGSMP